MRVIIDRFNVEVSINDEQSPPVGEASRSDRRADRQTGIPNSRQAANLSSKYIENFA